MQKLIIYIPLLIAITENLVNTLLLSSSNSRPLFIFHLALTTALTLSLVFILIDLFRTRNRTVYVSYVIKALTITMVMAAVIVFALTRSTDYGESFKSVWRYSISLLSLPLSMYYFYAHPNHIRTYIKNLYAAGIIYIVGVIIFSLFKIGRPLSYGETASIYGGGVGFFNIYPGVYIAIVTLILSLNTARYKQWIYTFKARAANNSYIVAAIVYIGMIFMIGKRDYILMVVIGAVVFILIQNRINIRKYIPTIIVGGVLLLAVRFTGFDELLLNELTGVRSIQTRQLKFEGRYLEYVDYIDEFNTNRDWEYFFLGKEIFNSRGKFFQYSSILPDRDRVLHSDVTHILYGTGVIGLLIFFFYNYKIVSVFRKIIQNVDRNSVVNFLWAIVLAIFAINFAVNFSGGLFRLFDKILQYQLMGVFMALIAHVSSESREP